MLKGARSSRQSANVLCASAAAVSLRGNIAAFVDSERRFDVVAMRGDRRSELGAVEHRQVRAFSGGRRQMRSVSKERDPRRAIPPMAGRQRVEHAQRWRNVAIGDQRNEPRRPAVEFGRDARRRRGGC